MTTASWSGPTGSGAAPGPAAPPTTSTTTTTSGGRRSTARRPLFERLTLEAFQSGLSWLTILRKRPAFRDAFAGFDADVVAQYDEGDVARLMADAGIVRNRRRSGPRSPTPAPSPRLRDAGGLDEVLWSFAPTDHTPPATPADVPATTPASVALAQGRSRGTGSSSSARRPCTPRCRRAGWWTTTCADATGAPPDEGPLSRPGGSRPTCCAGCSPSSCWRSSPGTRPR